MDRNREAFRNRFLAYKNGKSVNEIYDAGYIKEPVITPDPQYNEYINSLPDNQRLTPESSYRSHRYWELNGKPKNFSLAIQKGMFTMQADGWHANSVAENTNTGELEFMKSWNHPTVKKEYDWFKSKEASDFRKHYKLAGTLPYDKYIPKYKDGKSVREIYGLPGYAGGKFDAATKKKIDYYYKLLRNNGFDMMSAVGILGNMMQESSFNPNVVNHLGYHGLLLNSKAIQRAIKSQYGDLSEQSQLRYLSDWTDGSTWIRKGPYANDTSLYSKSYLRSGYKTPELAAFLFLKRYERAIVVDPKTNIPLRDTNGNYIYQDKDKRLRYAKSIYNYLSGQPDGIQELITLIGKTQPEPIIATQDATRVSTIPTIQQQAIDYSDRRNTVAAETERTIWAHKMMEDMKDAYQVPIWESPSLPALAPVEYDVTPLKTYAGGKLPEYQNGLTPQLIENIIVQNQGTILQGHRWSPLSSYANSTWRDYNKPFFLLFIEGGLGNAARGLLLLFESWNKEVRGIADITDHANVLLDILTGVGGKITKDSSKELIKNTKKAVKKVMQPTKASVKKEIKTLPELVEHHKQHQEELKPLKSKVYDDILEQVYKLSNYKLLKTGGKPLEFVKDEAYTAEFPNTVKTTAYHSPNGSVFDRVATENTNKFKIMGPHEYHHLLEEQIKYTPLQASILEQAFPLSEEFKKTHPNFNYLRERAAMNAELAYAIGNKYGFPVGPEFDNVVRNMSPWELEEIASSLSAYNKDSSVLRMFGGIDLLPKIPLKDALMRVPAGIGLYAGTLNEYKNGKISIKPSKRGTFTAAAKKHGASVREFESRVLKNPEKYSTAMVKKARFSRNARSWKH